MSETERRYAQIEKEALASTWACDKFSNYVLGKRFLIETDHKPLIPLLGTKHLDTLPPRVLRFRLRLARYDYDVTHIPGKLLYTADTLSRAPIEGENITLVEEAEIQIESVISHLPASTQTLEMYSQEQNRDRTCTLVLGFCRHGWPDQRPNDLELRPYWNERGKFSVKDNILLFGSRIVIPHSLRERTLSKDIKASFVVVFVPNYRFGGQRCPKTYIE